MDLSIRYLPQRFLPDKAIDLVDEAASQARLSARTLPPELRQLEERAVQAGRQLAQAIRKQDFEEAAMLREAEEGLLRHREWGGRGRQTQLAPRSVGRRSTLRPPVPVHAAPRRSRCADPGRAPEGPGRLLGQDQAVQTVARAIRRGGWD